MSIFYRHFGFQKYNINKKSKKINKNFTKEKILHYQFERIKQLIKHSYEYSPYYKLLFHDIDFNITKFKSLDDLTILPVLDRASVNNNINSIHIKNKYSNLNFSGGSSGTPVKFFQDRDYWEWGEISRNWSYNICNIKNENKLILWGTNFDWNSPDSFKGEFINYFRKQIFVNAFGISDQDLLKTIELVKKKNVRHLLGYASFVNYFADFVKKNNIDIDFETIQVTGENLLPNYRKNIESTFGKKVYDRYGSREVSIIGSTSIINYDHFEECFFHNYIETIEDENFESKILVTNLNNFCFPFLRYDIGDFSSKKTYKFGKPVIKNIYGRDYGTFKTPNGKNMNGIIFPHKFGQFKGISDFHIKIKKNKMDIYIIPNEEYSKETENNITDLIINKTDKSFELKIIKVEKINEYFKSGKRQIITIDK